VQPHPWTDHPQAAWSLTAEGARRSIGDYRDEGAWSSGAATGGHDITSVRDIGWHRRTLATWLTTLAACGFCLREVREPAGSDSDRADDGGAWAAVPASSRSGP
jgi:hypothetical protein